jgi:hypothetical protein
VGWAGEVAHMAQTRYTHIVVTENPQRKRELERHKHTWKNNIEKVVKV